MKAITLKQPWATAMMTLGKDVENRCWKMPASIMGQRVAIHAGLGWDRHGGELLAVVQNNVSRGCLLGSVVFKGFVNPRERVHAGLVAEEVEAVLRSRWAEPDSEFWWYVAEPRSLSIPIPCRGALGFWKLSDELLEKMSDDHRSEQIR